MESNSLRAGPACLDLNHGTSVTPFRCAVAKPYPVKRAPLRYVREAGADASEVQRCNAVAERVLQRG
jgi:hypothetical protein